MRDLRDPKLLGELLIHLRGWFSSVREAYDGFDTSVQDYNANPSPIEKYGRPQDLPPTPF